MNSESRGIEKLFRDEATREHRTMKRYYWQPAKVRSALMVYIALY